MNTIITDAAIDAAAEDMPNNTTDHEPASFNKEDAEELADTIPGASETSGIMPEVGDIDFSAVKLAAPPPVVLVSSPSGVTLGGVATAIAKGVAAGATAKVIGDALPDNTHWAVRLGATVTGGVIAAIAVGAAIDAATGWFGKDTVA